MVQTNCIGAKINAIALTIIIGDKKNKIMYSIYSYLLIVIFELPIEPTEAPIQMIRATCRAGCKAKNHVISWVIFYLLWGNNPL